MYKVSLTVQSLQAWLTFCYLSPDARYNSRRGLTVFSVEKVCRPSISRCNMTLTYCRKCTHYAVAYLCAHFLNDRNFCVVRFPTDRKFLAVSWISRSFATTVSFMSLFFRNSTVPLFPGAEIMLVVGLRLSDCLSSATAGLECGLDGFEASCELHSWEHDGLLNFMSKKFPFSTG